MNSSHISPESLAARRSSRWLLGGTVLGLFVIVALVLASDGPTLREVVTRVSPAKLLWPFLCTIASYAAMARSYQKIAEAAGLELSLARMMRITLVATAANYLVSTGGLSGLAVRSYFFSQQHRLGWGSAVSISLAQTFITNLVLFVFLCWGVLSLFFYDELSRPSLPFVALLFLVALTLCVIAVAVVASRGIRLRLFSALIGAVNASSRLFVRSSNSLRARLALFEEELHEGIDFLIARKSQMLSPLWYICLDWLLMLATLQAAFYAVGHSPPLHVVVIGFSAGIFLSTVNLIPGGLGLMEGSMAAVFAAFDVPLETAVVATVIFRLSYYALPMLLTVALFPETLQNARRASISGPADR